MSRAHIAILAVISLVMITPGSSAIASNFGSGGQYNNPPNQVSLANNNHHKMNFYSTTTANGAAMQWVLNNELSRGQFTWEWVDEDANWDVRFMDDNYMDNGVLGWVNCPQGATESGSNPNRTCVGQRLNFNQYGPYENTYDTTHGRRVMACHELGHTVGLQHTSNNNSCMQTALDTGWNPNNPNYPNTYSGHDIDHLKDEY